MPDALPLDRSTDGGIVLSGASFGWPVKPPVQFSVKADETPFKSASDDSGALLPPLAVGTVVESVDGQKIGEQTRVMTDGQVMMLSTDPRFSQRLHGLRTRRTRNTQARQMSQSEHARGRVVDLFFPRARASKNREARSSLSCAAREPPDEFPGVV